MPKSNQAQKQSIASDVDLLTNLLFAETKDPEDVIAIANVVINRTRRPKRFGNNISDVIYAPDQFTGVGSPEWEKAKSKNFTKQEREIYNRLNSVAQGVLSGVIPDPTQGADHYYNPDLASPSWGKVYPETYRTDQHIYLKEVPIVKKTKVKVITFLFLLLPSLCFAAAPDIRISDADGHVLNINSDGTLPVSTTNEAQTNTIGGAQDRRISDNDGEILNINADGTITLEITG